MGNEPKISATASRFQTVLATYEGECWQVIECWLSQHPDVTVGLDNKGPDETPWRLQLGAEWFKSTDRLAVLGVAARYCESHLQEVPSARATC